MSRSALKILPTVATMKKIMAVVPAFNEEGNIPGVIRELTNVRLLWSGYEVEFIIIDDGSKDRTREQALAVGAPIVSLPFNMGIGATVQTGFKYALQHGADFVVQVDGDGQHIPTEIQKLLPALEKNEADIVIGSRFYKGQKPGIHASTLLRWIAGRLLAKTIYLLTKKELTDTTSGFRIFNRKAAEFITENYPDDYPEVEVLVLLANHGFRIKEVPVEMRARRFGQSSISGWRSIYYVFKVIFASIMDKVRR